MVSLEDSRFCRHLSPAEQQVVRKHTVSRSVAAGEVIFHEGDDGDGLYVIHRGLIQIAAGAALGFIEIKGVASATTYSGMATIAGG